MSQKKLIVLSDQLREEDFRSRMFPNDCRIITVKDAVSIHQHDDAWAYFILSEEWIPSINSMKFNNTRLVFAAGVESTSHEFTANEQVVRLNTWPGFLRYPLLEMSAPESLHSQVKKVMDYLGWSYRLVADHPGLVTPRVIAMLVNEACFAVHEKVSTKAEIDTAMKLGTNYPHGPFEWSKKIGAGRIISLLRKLSSTDNRYDPAPGIEKILTEPE